MKYKKQFNQGAVSYTIEENTDDGSHKYLIVRVSPYRGTIKKYTDDDFLFEFFDAIEDMDTSLKSNFHQKHLLVKHIVTKMFREDR